MRLHYVAVVQLGKLGVVLMLPFSLQLLLIEYVCISLYASWFGKHPSSLALFTTPKVSSLPTRRPRNSPFRMLPANTLCCAWFPMPFSFRSKGSVVISQISAITLARIIIFHDAYRILLKCTTLFFKVLLLFMVLLILFIHHILHQMERMTTSNGNFLKHHNTVRTMIRKSVQHYAAPNYS